MRDSGSFRFPHFGDIIQAGHPLSVLQLQDSINLNAFEEYMQPLLLNNIKTNPDLKIYRDNKTTMAYYYKDMNGEFITKISITEDLYKVDE